MYAVLLNIWNSTRRQKSNASCEIEKLDYTQSYIQNSSRHLFLWEIGTRLKISQSNNQNPQRFSYLAVRMKSTIFSSTWKSVFFQEQPIKLQNFLGLYKMWVETYYISYTRKETSVIRRLCKNMDVEKIWMCSQKASVTAEVCFV